MAIPLKTGADLYNNELLRARLHNHPADALDEYGVGSFYFNNSSGLNSSNRMRYRGLTAWHSVANLEDIEDVKDLIKALSGSLSESVASVLGRVITLEGYFSNGKAKDADLLDGHNSDYFATATTVNDLLEDYESFKAVFADNSDDYINTWTEVKNFLDGIKNTEDLNAILLGINTELGNKADKATTLAGYGITDAVLNQDYINLNDLATERIQVMGYGNPDSGWKTYSSGLVSKIRDNGFALQGLANTLFFRGISDSVWEDNWHEVLHTGNYASKLDTRYLQLTGGELSGGLTIKNNSGLYFKDTLGKAILALYVNSANKLILGAGANEEGYSTYIEGKNVYVNNNIALHGGNYSDLITDLNGNLNVKGRLLVGGATDDGNSALAVKGHARTTALTISSALYINRDWLTGKMNDANNSGLSINTTAEAVSFSVWNKAGVLASDSLLKLDTSRKATIEGDLYVTGHIIADGQVSSGGIGSEGSGSGASGIVILEDWEKYDDTLAQVLGAGLGVGLRDKIAALESKATNVSVAQTLTSGKEIGTITIDGVATKLFAPDDYLPLSGGTLNGSLGMTSAKIPDGAVGLWGTGSLYLKASDKVSFYNSSTGAFNEILHKGNYASVLDSAYLKLSGGTLTDSVMVNHSSGSKGYLLLTNGASIGGLVTNGTAVELFNVNGYGIGVEGTSDVYVLTNWSKKTLLHAGNYNSYALPITGGTISGALTIQSGDDGKLIFDNTDAETYWGLIYFKQNGETYGRFGTQGTTDLSWNSNLILHSGNIGDFAFVPRIGIINNTDADALLTNGVYLNATGNGSGNSNFPSAYSVLMTFTQHSNYAAQLSVAGNAVHIRRKLDTWSAWKELAFTDSTVAAAKVLVAPTTNEVVLGTNDNKRLFDFSNKQIYEAGASGIADYPYYQMFGDISAGASILQGSKLVTLSTGGINRLWVNSSGNVTIGSSDLAGTKAKLFIGGGPLCTYGIVTSVALGTLPTRGSVLTTETYAYGMSQWITQNGNGHIQVGRFDGNANAYNLLLQELGGNVGIGTTDPLSKLHVKGDLRVSGNYDYLSFSMSDVNATYNAYDAADGWCNHNFLSNGTLMFFISGREIEWSHFATPLWVKKELKVDASAYFNGVTFISSRLLVGNPTDSGWVPFQVKGAADIDGPLYISAHSKEGIYFNENGIHWHNTSAGWVSALMEFSSSAILLHQHTTINGDLKVTGNIIADGQVSSGGVAEAGTGGATGGSALDRVPFTIPVNTTSFTCEHNLGTREISVSIYEEGNDFQQVLTDVYLDSDNTARIVFGAATDVVHKVVIIG